MRAALRWPRPRTASARRGADLNRQIWWTAWIGPAPIKPAIRWGKGFQTLTLVSFLSLRWLSPSGEQVSGGDGDGGPAKTAHACGDECHGGSISVGWGAHPKGSAKPCTMASAVWRGGAQATTSVDAAGARRRGGRSPKAITKPTLPVPGKGRWRGNPRRARTAVKPARPQGV